MADTLGATRDSTASKPRPRALLFGGLQCHQPRKVLDMVELSDDDTATIGRSATSSIDRVGSEVRFGLDDPLVSEVHARILRSEGRWVFEDADSRNGTYRDGSRHRRASLLDGDIIDVGGTILVFRIVDCEPPVAPPPSALATRSPLLASAFGDLARVAATSVSIVITGETGTGKEVTARAIHELSGRAGPFVAVNCAAIAPELVASELFGHRKGAFSGAIEDRPGLIRSADGGTLLFDEIADLPATSQAALLRVLQEREVLSVGSAKPIPVDVRTLAASNQSLVDLVEGGSFRSDLYARLAAFSFELPALRERIEDLGVLIATVLERVAPNRDVELTLQAGRALFSHAWPLNIRELEQVFAAAVALAEDGRIDVAQLPAEFRESRSELGPRDAARRAELVELMTEHKGNVGGVARALAKHRTQVYRWLARYGLAPESFRSD